MQDNSTVGAPIFFKWVVLITVLTGITSLFTGILVSLFANYPFYTLLYVNLWRLFTSVLVSQGLILSISSAVVMYFVLPELQRSISTTITFADFIITNAIVQLGYSLVWLGVYIITDDEQIHSSGLWMIWMTYIVRICESDPTGNIQVCCLPFMVRKKLYPLIAVGLVGVLGWRVPVDMLVAYVMGVVACKWFDGSFVKLTTNAYRRLEESFLLGWMSQRDDFCKISSSPKAKYFCSDNQHNYKEFYQNFMKSGNQSHEGVMDTIPSSPAPGFSDMQGNGIVRSVVSLDDIRSHWTSKQNDENDDNQPSSTSQEKPDSQKQSEGEKDTTQQGSYTTFAEEQEK